jgi:hypothetical protein
VGSEMCIRDILRIHYTAREEQANPVTA